MAVVTYDELIELARAHRGAVLHTTKRGKPFSVAVDRDRLVFTPESTGKPRPESRKGAQAFLDRYNATGSMRPGDYTNDNHNPAYFCALVQLRR